MDVLKEIRREIYPLAPLREHGEDGTTGRADENDKNGANPQVEVGVSTSAAIAVLVTNSDLSQSNPKGDPRSL